MAEKTNKEKNANPEVKKKSIVNKEPERVFIYIGPSIKGEIQCGTIFHGTKRYVLKLNKGVIEKYPQVSEFIIEASMLREVKEKLRKSNSLSKKYKELLKIRG